MFVAIVGGAGSGKSTLARLLVKKKGFEETVSYTTRPKRKGEEEGKDYYFLKSKNEFLKLVGFGEVAEYTEYNSNFYGTPSKYIRDMEKNYVSVVTPSGLRRLREFSKREGIFVKSIYLDVDEETRAVACLARGTKLEETYNRILIDRGLLEGVENDVSHRIANKNMVLSPEEVLFECCRKLGIN